MSRNLRLFTNPEPSGEGKWERVVTMNFTIIRGDEGGGMAMPSDALSKAIEEWSQCQPDPAMAFSYATAFLMTYANFREGGR